MQYVLVCPEGSALIAYQQGLNPCCFTRCYDGTNITVPVSAPVTMGLADLAWADVNTLIGALLLSCTIAVSFNILGRMFYRG